MSAALAAVEPDDSVFIHLLKLTLVWRLAPRTGSTDGYGHATRSPLRSVLGHFLRPILVAGPGVPARVAAEIPEVAGPAGHLQKTDVSLDTLRTPSKFHRSHLG